MAFTQASFTQVAKSVPTLHASVLERGNNAADSSESESQQSVKGGTAVAQDEFDSGFEPEVEPESGVEEYYPEEYYNTASDNSDSDKTSEQKPKAKPTGGKSARLQPVEPASDSDQTMAVGGNLDDVIYILESEDEPKAKKRKIMANLKKIDELLKEIKELEGGSE
jgi:hypothetical protein